MADLPVPAERAQAELMGVDPELAEQIAHMLVAIEVNYRREGSGPGSRFAGMRLEYVQACAAIRHQSVHAGATTATRDGER